jgi:hypothetical protein
MNEGLPLPHNLLLRRVSQETSGLTLLLPSFSSWKFGLSSVSLSLAVTERDGRRRDTD